jgi:hypothetical protein
MPLGKLGQAINNWIYDTIQPEGGSGWWSRVKSRWGIVKTLHHDFITRQKFTLSYAYPTFYTAAFVYLITGDPTALDMATWYARSREGTEFNTDIETFLYDAANSDAVRGITEFFGTVVSTPLYGLLDKYAGRDDFDPKNLIQEMQGLQTTVHVINGLADLTLETLSAGQLEGLGRTLDTLYRGLGMHRIGEAATRPLIEVGLMPSVSRWYQEKYRPLRFSAAELRDLYALGEISEAQLRSDAAYLGWRNADINEWIKLSYRTLTQGDVFDAYNTGKITDTEAIKRLRALGYNPADIPLLFKINPPPEAKTANLATATTARAAFREGLIGEAELRSLLAALNMAQRETDLIVDIEKANRTQDTRAASLSQIREAWTENVITDPEAVNWLRKANFGAEEVSLLMETWKAANTPTWRKLNVGTITSAYVEGVIGRNAAKTKLIEVGLRDEDAELELNLTEKRNPAAFGTLPPPAARVLSPSTLAELVIVGLITPAVMVSRLVTAGYTVSDATMLAELAMIRGQPSPRELPQRTIEQAYKSGVLNRSGATAELLKIGYSASQAALILTTLDAELAAAGSVDEIVKLKTLSVTMLEDLLIAGLIQADFMQVNLVGQGYKPDEAALLVERAVQLATPVKRVVDKAIIERAYLAGVLDRSAAMARLLALDYDAAAAAVILDTVESENPAVFTPGLIQSTRVPSIAALVTALQRGIIDEAYYLKRAMEIGFSPEDAVLYVSIATKQERKSTKALTQSQITSAYGHGFMTWAAALDRLTSLGYDNADATLILRMELDKIENTEAWNMLLTGGLGAFDVVAQLVNAGYADADILAAFAALGAAKLATLQIDLTALQAALKEIPGGE